MTTILLGFLYIILALTSLLLIGLVLIQDSKSGGLSSAFGGGGGESVLGAGGQSGITRFTTVLSAVFLGLCVIVGIVSKIQVSQSDIDPSNELRGVDNGSGNGTGLSPDGTPGGAGTGMGGASNTPPGAQPTPPSGDGQPTGGEDKPPVDGGDGTPTTPADSPDDDSPDDDLPDNDTPDDGTSEGGG